MNSVSFTGGEVGGSALLKASQNKRRIKVRGTARVVIAVVWHGTWTCTTPAPLPPAPPALLLRTLFGFWPRRVGRGEVSDRDLDGEKVGMGLGHAAGCCPRRWERQSSLVKEAARAGP